MSELRRRIGEPRIVSVAEANRLGGGIAGQDFLEPDTAAVILYGDTNVYIEIAGGEHFGKFYCLVCNEDVMGTLEECEAFLFDRWVQHEYPEPSMSVDSMFLEVGLIAQVDLVCEACGENHG